MKSSEVITSVIAAAVVGFCGWLIAKEYKSSKEDEKNLKEEKEKQKYNYDTQVKKNRELIFCNPKLEYSVDTKSDAFSFVEKLNEKCRDANTTRDFKACYSTLDAFIDIYKKGNEDNVKAFVKTSIAKEAVKEVEERSSSPCIKLDSRNVNEILSTVKAVAALNSGITNDYYKWRLASRW